MKKINKQQAHHEKNSSEKTIDFKAVVNVLIRGHLFEFAL